MSTRSLDKSLCVPVTTQLSEDDSSECNEDSQSYTNDDAQQMHKKWLKEQPKHNIDDGSHVHGHPY